MLEFYEFNTFNICVVMVSTFVIYYILSNTIDKGENNGDVDKEFSIEYLLIAILSSVGISLGLSYVMSGSDEALLTDNYWENTSLE